MFVRRLIPLILVCALAVGPLHASPRDDDPRHLPLIQRVITFLMHLVPMDELPTPPKP